MERARESLSAAYAPYSRFRVGAAVLAEDGRVFGGANIENASYGLTVCAERVAIFAAVSAGARQLSAIALTTASLPRTAEEAMPCGACRQVMAEFMSRSARVLVDHVGDFELEQLLPSPFRLQPAP